MKFDDYNRLLESVIKVRRPRPRTDMRSVYKMSIGRLRHLRLFRYLIPI